MSADTEKHFADIVARKAEFKKELFALFEKYGCSFDQERAYYAGDSETLSVKITLADGKPSVEDMSMEDLIEESGRPFSR